jgi:hypothetical protein
LKERVLAISIISIFVLSAFAVSLSILPARAATSGGVVAFDYYHVTVGNQTLYRPYGYPQTYSDEIANRVDLVGNLTNAGYTVTAINQTTPITSSNLANVNVLFLGKISDPSLNYTSGELSAIASWFKTGGKTLMVSGDSDYTSNETDKNAWHESITNNVLNAIGSQMRLDFGEVTDQPGVGAQGSGFRLYAAAANNGINTNGWAGTITANTHYVGFHGTTDIVCYTGGKYVLFSSCSGLGNTIDWLYRTSAQGTLQLYGTARPLVTPNATAGQWVVAAAEKIAEGGSYSKVVLAGAGFYGDYVINRDIEFSYPTPKYDGIHFVIQAVQWGTTVESVPVDYTYYYVAVAVVVVIVVVAVSLYLMRRKPKAAAAMPKPAT